MRLDPSEVARVNLRLMLRDSARHRAEIARVRRAAVALAFQQAMERLVEDSAPMRT